MLSGVAALRITPKRRYRAWMGSKRWWAAVDSNHLPPRYQHGALPVELAAHAMWQGRKDSNPRHLLLESSALTRLSYAPSARPQVYPVRRILSAPTAAWHLELVATRIPMPLAPALRAASRAASRSTARMVPTPNARWTHRNTAGQ